MRVLALAASRRPQSLNHKLVTLAASIARQQGAEVDLADFREFDMPLYDGELEQREGLPAGARELQRRLEQAEAVMLATPEYNYSIAGVLKNAIDWVSRARPMPWRGKSVYLMSASPSPMGGIRGLWQTRIPLEGCGALVFPDMFALPHADRMLDSDGGIADATLDERLRREILGFVRLAEAVLPVCVKPRTAAAQKRQREIATALEDETALQPGADRRGGGA
jgi:chromate reductase